MELHLVTDEKIAETSSKGNQEKWYDSETDRWYKNLSSQAKIDATGFANWK